ncbi:MAG: hypothetical protein IKZ39_08480 [Lachnospiraceae bacterium]|nr:hypothetical protein [Lachnospiraceae bacterium]
MKFKGLRGILILLFAAMAFAGIFFRLNNKQQGGSEEEEVVEATPIEIALERNLTTNYPGTPKEVVKYFSEITQCYYNETFDDDEQLEALARQMLKLYDDELVSYKSYEDYMFDLKSDINFYNENGYKISSYAPSQSTDVVFFTEDGFEWARLWCAYTIKSGKYYKTINEVFVLRKDDKSHWRIYGWKEDNG